MLTVLSFFAREESKSVSENIKWRYKRKFEQMEERQENDNSLVQYKAKQFIRILADVGKNTVLGSGLPVRIGLLRLYIAYW